MHGHGGAGLAHAAFLYSSPTDVVNRLVPLIEDDLARDHGVLVCVDDAKAELLGDVLGEAAKRVTFVPKSVRYARPAVAVDELNGFLQSTLGQGAPAVHAIGELDLDGGERDADWLRYEAAINDIFAAAPLQATCLYPRSLPTSALTSVARTHPFVAGPDGVAPSGEFDGAHGIVLAPIVPGRDADVVAADITEARRARSIAADATAAFTQPPLTQDLALVVSELVTNALLHGGTAASLGIWIESTSVVLQVNDDGPGIDDPFAGLRPPSLPMRGAGLWVAHLLCDRITIDRSPSGGASVTVRLDRPS